MRNSTETENADRGFALVIMQQVPAEVGFLTFALRAVKRTDLQAYDMIETESFLEILSSLQKGLKILIREHAYKNDAQAQYRHQQMKNLCDMAAHAEEEFLQHQKGSNETIDDGAFEMLRYSTQRICERMQARMLAA